MPPNQSTNATFGYALLAPDKASHRYVYRAGTEFGTYNHGPMLSFHLGVYWMEWYNGVDTEGVRNRVLYSTSKDAVKWTAPAVLFNATGKIGVENEAQVLIENWRLFYNTARPHSSLGYKPPAPRTILPATFMPPYRLEAA